MRGAMRGVALFLAGIIVGAGLMTSLAAQGTLNTGLRLNHVGISVPNFQETVTFYEKVMGFRVSHRFAPNPDGRPGTAFVRQPRHVHRDRARHARRETDDHAHRHRRRRYQGHGGAPRAERRQADRAEQEREQRLDAREYHRPRRHQDRAERTASRFHDAAGDRQLEIAKGLSLNRDQEAGRSRL